MALSQAKRSLVTMLVLLVGAAAALYFGVVRQTNEDEAQTKADDTASAAFSFKSADVKKVTLTAKGATTVIEKDGDNWKITSPVNARADKSTIDTLVTKVTELKAKNLKAAVKDARPEFLVASGQDHLKEYGIDKPRFVVKLDGDGKTGTLTIGTESAYDQSMYYTRDADNRIYLADSSLRFPLDKGLMDLRDKSLVTHDDKDVQTLAVTGNGIAWSVQRDGDGWKLTTPMQDKADKSEVEGILSKLHTTKAKSYPAETAPTDAAGLAKYGLDKPEVEIIFGIGADKARKTLQIGNVQDGGVKKAYSRIVEGGAVAEIDPNVVKDLLKPANQIRDKTIAPFDREKVGKLHLSTSDGDSLLITRTKVPAPDGGQGSEEFSLDGHTDKLKSWKVTSAMYTLSNLKGAGIADDAATDLSKYGLDKPARTYAVMDDAGKDLSRILIGRTTPVGGRYYASKAGDSRVYEVDKAAIDNLPRKPEDVLDSQPAAVSTTGAASTPKPLSVPPHPMPPPPLKGK